MYMYMYAHIQYTDLVLVDSNDVSEEGEELDLNCDKINVSLSVEVRSLPRFERRLEDYCLHGERDELCHCVVDCLLVELKEGEGARDT